MTTTYFWFDLNDESGDERRAHMFEAASQEAAHQHVRQELWEMFGDDTDGETDYGLFRLENDANPADYPLNLADWYIGGIYGFLHQDGEFWVFDDGRIFRCISESSVQFVSNDTRKVLEDEAAYEAKYGKMEEF